MPNTRLVLVGGFLGAGKTTLITRAAQRLAGQGYRVAVVTNDQGRQLVDTAFVADQSLAVEEIAGGCFCCRFPDLLSSLRHLRDETQPDVILAEPVGSCTDLAATVVRPLLQHYPGEFDLAPLTIVLDPHRTLETFEPTVDYLHERQLAEAEIIAVNKGDLLDEADKNATLARLRQSYPGARVISLAARTGSGVDGWLGQVLADGAPQPATLDIDYATYARAEASLGWLNTRLALTGAPTLSPTVWMTRLLTLLNQMFAAQRIAVAHLKLHLKTPAAAYKASLTGGQSITWDSAVDETVADQAAVILNARVNAGPEQLQAIARQAIADVCGSLGLSFAVTDLECFSPLPPNPTFRLV